MPTVRPGASKFSTLTHTGAFIPTCSACVCVCVCVFRRTDGRPAGALNTGMNLRNRPRYLTITLLIAACALIGVGCAQVKPEPDAVAAAATRGAVNNGADVATARMDAKWVSAIVGMKVETPAGARLGRVQDVVIDSYGRASFAIVSYGGVMGAGTRYTAVPWAAVAEMLDRDTLLVDRSNLENSPLLLSAKPEPGNKDWRRAAENYWTGKVAVAR
jgi:sporulation protein YlmC with PRC-barrel domain